MFSLGCSRAVFRRIAEPKTSLSIRPEKAFNFRIRTIKHYNSSSQANLQQQARKGIYAEVDKKKAHNRYSADSPTSSEIVEDEPFKNLHQHKNSNDRRYYMSHSINSLIKDQQNDMFFGSEFLNRVSFLRENAEFITKAAQHPSTRYIAYSKTNPLVDNSLNEKLAIFTNGDNQGGSFSAGLSKSELWQSTVSEWTKNNREGSEVLRGPGRPTIVFLGLQDESVGLNLADLKEGEDVDEKFFDFQGKYQGIAYFAIDIHNAPQLEEVFYGIMGVKNTEEAVARGVYFSRSVKHYLSFTHLEAALYSQGKMFLDWLSRNSFCPGCGDKVVPINGGGKLKCTNTKRITRRTSSVGSISSKSSHRSSDGGDMTAWACPAKSATVTNVQFPRTDAVIITAITNTDRSKILLSLSKRHAATKMYACTAGFMEPSETVEIATKREIWEETGVVCKDIQMVMTQPWPFPGNLMIGCLGVVEFNGENEKIHLDHDRELADARWFDTNTIKKWIYEGNHIDNPDDILLPLLESIAFLLIKLAVDQALSKL